MVLALKILAVFFSPLKDYIFGFEDAFCYRMDFFFTCLNHVKTTTRTLKMFNKNQQLVGLQKKVSLLNFFQ